MVQPYDMPELEPVELGGSVFVEVNKNLWRAVDEFGFERIPFENASDVVGIWDGQEFVAMVCAMCTMGRWRTCTNLSRSA